MRRARGLLIVAIVLVAAGTLAILSVAIVDESEYVIVTDFGRPVAVYGDEPGEAGPHLKRPWQSSIAIDRRVRASEPPVREVITGDKRNLEVAPLIVWQVADPSLYLRAAGSIDAAQARLEERVAAALNDAIGRLTLENLATTEADAWRLDQLTEEVRAAVAGPAREELGVEVVDVRLRRFNHPLEVRPAIFDLIRSERAREASRLRAEGEAEHRKLTSRADRERAETLAKADAEAQRIRAEGEAQAARILNDAQARDPEFYRFLRTLDAYRAILDEKATVVLSASNPLLQLLREGPTPSPLPTPATAATVPAEDRP